MLEFNFKKPINKIFHKNIGCYFYDGENLDLWIVEATSKNLSSYKDKPSITRYYYGNNGFVPESIDWDENGVSHRIKGPATIELKCKSNNSFRVGRSNYFFYRTGDLHLLPETFERQVIAKKYIEGELLFTKQIKTLEDWFNFDRQQDIISECNF